MSDAQTQIFAVSSDACNSETDITDDKSKVNNQLQKIVLKQISHSQIYYQVRSALA